jgi:hypothetical protein
MYYVQQVLTGEAALMRVKCRSLVPRRVHRLTAHTAQPVISL